MGFITEAQYRELTDRESRRKQRIISIDDFADQSARTLTFSVGISGWVDAAEHEHVFIADGLLNVHVYSVFDNGQTQTTYLRSGQTMLASSVRSFNRRGTESTDFEFALLMEGFHLPLQFFPPGDKRGQVDRIGQFLGLVSHQGEAF